MKFREYAVNETSLLVSRVLAKRSKNAVNEFKAFRQALDEASQAFEKAVAAWAKGEPDGEMSDFVERVTAAAASQVQALSQQAKAEAQASIETAKAEARASIEAVKAEAKASIEAVKAEAQASLDASRKELEARVAETRAAAAALKDAKTHAEKLQAECQTEKDRTQAARAETAKAQEAHAVAAAACRDAEAAKEQESRAKIAAEGELKKLRAALEASESKVKAAIAEQQTIAKQAKAAATQIEALERSTKEHERARHDIQAKLDAAAEAEVKLRERMTEAEKEMKRARAEAQTTAQAVTQAAGALETERAQVSQSLGRLLKIFENLAQATTMGEGLTALAKGLKSDFSRVALFNVKGNHLEGADQIGFDSKSNISKVVIPLTMDSVVTRAVSSGRVEAIAGRDAADDIRATFGGTPACLLALPIAVHDEIVAVIYADDSGRSPIGSEALDQMSTVAELLRCHAPAVLAKFAVDPKTLEERRAYAKLLLDEVEYMYTADINDGKKDAEVKSHLKDNLQTARQMYAQRYASEGPSAAPLLEEHLVSVIEARKTTPFGRDLTAIVGRAARGQEKGSRAAGQAS